MEEQESTRRIGDIRNYYGCLKVKTVGDKFYWGIEGVSGTRWQEIPKSLHDELIRFEESE